MSIVAGKRAVIVGSGPSGFFAAEQLLKFGFEVDMLDKLPTPFGLVRSGVAPDHPKIKSVIRVFEKIAATKGFRFYGGVSVGENVSRQDLLNHYHVVVYALGMSEDNRLGVPGEDRPGSHPATHFVAWYNGHPDGADRSFDLSCRRAVVIGNGNVALDVARMLVLPPEELATTDTADHAIAALARSQINEVVILGRRGPAQAAFTNPELEELGHLSRTDVIVDKKDLELDAHSMKWLEEEAHPTHKFNMETLGSYAACSPKGSSHRISFRFLCSPVEILGAEGNGRVAGVRIVKNRVEPTRSGGFGAVPTDAEEIIECGLVLRCIGYRGAQIDDVPFDERRGLIRNEQGRVVDEKGRRQAGEYVVGWVKRGPSGVIGTNKKDAADTVEKIIEDAEIGGLNVPAAEGADHAAALFARHVPGGVGWKGWQAIDAAERSAGRPHGRERIKFVRRSELLAAAREARPLE
jgi:ferredoxin--NADP+ reductase